MNLKKRKKSARMFACRNILTKILNHRPISLLKVPEKNFIRIIQAILNSFQLLKITYERKDSMASGLIKEH